ncbi:MAG TPA: uroporphyrinogen-III synthase [Burkholderiaceae bacterium]|nr:uroporphyrinogen-III synthase [Burkholderiaceae bacterium]
MNRRPIIVTRAGEPGRALARALEMAGEESLWVPAFEIGPAPDARLLAEVLARLAGYKLAVFVSPAAVEALAPRLAQPWPRATAIGVVGAGTRRAVLAGIRGAANVKLFAPEAAGSDGEGSGSEQLWQALQPAIDRFDRVLILRAEHGREWLADQMRAAGATVDAVAVYTRRTVPIAAAAAATVRGWQATGRTVVLVVASSEAVDAVVGRLDALAGAAWTRTALALASHERIAQRLRAAGFARVEVAPLEVEAIRKATGAQ